MEPIFVILILAVIALLIAPLVLSIIAVTQVNQFRETMRRHEHLIGQLQDHLLRLEQQLRGGAQPAVVPPEPVPKPGVEAPPARPSAAEPPRVPPFIRPTEAIPPPAPKPTKGGESLEEKIGKRWTVWVGVVILFLAVGFFVKYAIDNGWLGPTARVVLGTLFGLAMLMTGDRFLRRGWRALGEGLLGGGLAIIYLSLYAGFALYHLSWFPTPAAFATLVMLTALGMALAVIDNALSLAVLAVLGGLLTPIMVSTGGDARDILMTYLLILDLGVLGVAFYQEWRWLDALAFAGTWLLFFGWFSSYYQSSALAPAMIWVSVFYLVFLVLPFAYHLRNGIPVTAERFVLALLNAAVAFAFAYTILYHQHPRALGFIALGISATTLVMGSLTRRRLPGDATTLFGFIALSVTFLTLAIPLELKAYGIFLLWAVEGPVLLYLGYRFRYFPVRVGGFIVLALAVVRLFAVHWPLHEGLFTPFFNVRFLSVISLPAAIAAYTLIHDRWRREGNETDDTLKVVSGIAAGLLAIFLVQTELGFWLDATGHRLAAGFVRAVIWATGGLLFMLVGLRIRRLIVQVVGVIPLVAALILSIMMYGSQATYPLFFNPRFGAAVLVVLCGFFAWREIFRQAASRDLQQLLFALFEITLFLLLSLEAYVNASRGIADYERARWVSQMALTITWGVYAIVLLAAGFRRLSRGMRYTALAIFGVTVAKLLFIDLATLDPPYRILAFFVTGLLILGASYLYHHLERRLATAVGDES